MNRIYWKIYTEQSRHAIMYELPKLINSLGMMVNFAQLSDYCINFLIEIDTPELINLQKLLAETFLTNLDLPTINRESATVIYLSVIFKSASGELKNIIPHVPG